MTVRWMVQVGMLTGGAVCLVLAAVLAWGAAAGLAVAGLLLIGGELLL